MLTRNVLTAAVLSAVCIVSHTRADDQPKPAAAPAAPAPAASPELDVTADKLMAHIRMLPTKRAAWGDDAHIRGLRETEALLVKALKDMGYQPELHPVDFLGSRGGDKEAMPDKPWNNIIVDIKGTTHPKDVLILGAHFDAVIGAPGADDNGTGTACLLEAARVLKGRPMQRTVRLIFFNLEEAGLVGSRAYVEQLKPRLESKEETILGMVSMDMLGFYSDKPDSQKSPIPPMGAFKPPTVADFIAMAGLLKHRHFSQALDKAMHASQPGTDTAPGVKTVVVDFLPIAPRDLLRSDHAPFLAVGIPAVIISDTANFRSPHYHKATDTIETLDPERFATTSRAIIGAFYRLGGPDVQALIDLTPPSLKPEAPQPDTSKPE